MTDYKCDICGKKATVHITKFISGQKLKFHLCEACSKDKEDKLKALVDTQIALKKKKAFHVEDVIDNMLAGAKKSPKSLVCPNCNSSFEDFEKSTKVACEHCYEAFSKKFNEILGQIHLATEHKGKLLYVPKKARKAKKKSPSKTLNELENLEDLEVAEIIEEATLAKLNNELALAISQERYEDAALLRDKIKSLKNDT